MASDLCIVCSTVVKPNSESPAHDVDGCLRRLARHAHAKFDTGGQMTPAEAAALAAYPERPSMIPEEGSP